MLEASATLFFILMDFGILVMFGLIGLGLISTKVEVHKVYEAKPKDEDKKHNSEEK